MLKPPTLFKICAKEALKIWEDDCRETGVNVNVTSTVTVQFADDKVIIVKSIND